MKKKITLLLKIIITFAMLWFVLQKIDIQKLKSTLHQADTFWLLGAFIAFNISKILSSVRLNIYFNALGLKLSQSYNLILYYIGMFYNLFLPGGIGGDGYKIYLLNKHFHHKIKPLFKAVLHDRLSGLAGLVLYACFLYIFSDYARIYSWSRSIAWIFAFLVFPMAYILTKFIFPLFMDILKTTMIWGLIVQLWQLACAWMILQSLGISDFTIEYLTLFLISSVVAVLPLTIGGVGVRELTFLYGLEQIGQDPSLGVTFSFLFFMITAVSSLFGIFLLNKATPLPA